LPEILSVQDNIDLKLFAFGPAWFYLKSPSGMVLLQKEIEHRAREPCIQSEGFAIFPYKKPTDVHPCGSIIEFGEDVHDELFNVQIWDVQAIKGVRSMGYCLGGGSTEPHG